MVLTIYCDGGARGNPGPAACAFVVKDKAGNIREKRGKYLGIKTNNEAEYAAIIEAWRWIGGQVNAGISRYGEVNFYLDSKLVVNQLNGFFKVKEARLREMLVKVRQLEHEQSVLKFSYSYIPRGQNWEADLLVNQTLDWAS